RLKTDRIDLWQIHALESPEDVEKRLAGGVLDMALKAREKGLIRHLGFTGHSSPYAHLRMLELAGDAFAACQFPVNPVDAASRHSFVRQVIPEAGKAGYGMLAMKTLADGRFFSEKQVNTKVTWTTEDPIVPKHLSLEDSIYFALSQPVAVLITGAEKPEYLNDKVALVESYRTLTPDQLTGLANRLRSFAEAGNIEYYKSRDLAG
ncbi:MAG: aldo/keto reductase, partial [Terrimicrobiaceae bacterium]